MAWSGLVIGKFQEESRWKDGAFVENSIQDRFIEHLAEGPATFIFDDDNGESADAMSIEETTDTVIVYLWHCQYAGGETSSRG